MVTTALDLTAADGDLLALHERFHTYDFTPDDFGAVKVHHELTAELVKRGLSHGHTDDAWAHAVVEVESLTLDLTVVKAEVLPLDLVAAVMEAQRYGIHTADIVAFLNVNGYEVRVVPAGEQAGEPFPTAEHDPGYDRDDDDHEHEDEYEVEDAAPGTVREGTFVAWDSSGGTARGQVEHVMTEGTLGVPGTEFSIDATPEDPAALIRIWRQTAEGWAATETLVGHKVSTLRVIEALNKADTYAPPEGVQAAAKRALEWIAEGRAGDGFTDVGRARASQLARGEGVSEDTIRRMNSYFARHEPDKRATGFTAGEAGFPTPGRVAWDAWGGDPGASWAGRIMRSLGAEKAAGSAAVSPSQARGGVLQKAEERRFTLGPWYIPDMLDAHGEWTDSTELQAALWGYVKSGDRGIRLQHNRAVVAGEWVECMTWPYEVTVPMTMPDGTVHRVTYPAETVFLGVVWEPWAWEYVKSGRVLGYSIGGKAERLMVDLPDEDGE